MVVIIGDKPSVSKRNYPRPWYLMMGYWSRSGKGRRLATELDKFVRATAREHGMVVTGNPCTYFDRATPWSKVKPWTREYYLRGPAMGFKEVVDAIDKSDYCIDECDEPPPI